MTGYIDATLVLKTRDKEKVNGQNPKAKDNTFLQQHGSMNKASASSPDQAAA